MRRDKIKDYINLALKAGYAVIGSDKLDGYDKKLYLILIDKNSGKCCKKIYENLKKRNIEGYEVESLFELCNINCKIIAFKNKGLSDEIKKYINKE